MKTNTKSRIFVTSVLLVMLSLVLSACGPSATPAPTQDVGMIQTQSAQTVVADLTLNAPPPPTATLPSTDPTPNPNIPVAVVPTAAAGSPSAVANSRTTIYSGPGTNYVVYGDFPERPERPHHRQERGWPVVGDQRAGSRRRGSAG